MSGADNSNEPDSRPDDVFLERWSRRKTAARNSDTATGDAPAALANGQPEEAEPLPELTDDDMPPIESLDRDSDYSVFMSPGVSDHLRTRALRKLFHMPDFNITDGLNDYDEDYTQFAGLGGVVTHEMKRLLKRELDAKAAAAEDPVPAADNVAALQTDNVAENTADEDDDSEESV